MKKSHPNLKLAEECLALINKYDDKKVIFTTQQLIEKKRPRRKDFTLDVSPQLQADLSSSKPISFL